MQARFYTLAEARAALPEVKRLMAQIQAARQAILRLRPELLPAMERAAANGGSRATGELYLHGLQLEQGVKTLLGMGIHIKDLERGLLDFLGHRGEREIFLCWLVGEEDIAYWHELNGGFAGRHPLDEHIR